jgi:hypothetical protein
MKVATTNHRTKLDGWPSSPAASRATACAPTPCLSRSSANAPSRLCRTSRASRARRTGSTVGRSPGGASRRRRARCPAQESSQVRSAQSARSYDGRGRPAKPTAARRSWPRWSTGYSISWSARTSTDGGMVRPSAPHLACDLSVFVVVSREHGRGPFLKMLKPRDVGTRCGTAHGPERPGLEISNVGDKGLDLPVRLNFPIPQYHSYCPESSERSYGSAVARPE